VSATLGRGNAMRRGPACGCGTASTHRCGACCFRNRPHPALTGQGCWRAVMPRPPEIDSAFVFVGAVKAGTFRSRGTRCKLFRLQNVPDTSAHAEERFPRLGEAVACFGGALRRGRDGLGPSSRITYRPVKSF